MCDVLYFRPYGNKHIKNIHQSEYTLLIRLISITRGTYQLLLHKLKRERDIIITLLLLYKILLLQDQ